MTNQSTRLSRCLTELNQWYYFGILMLASYLVQHALKHVIFFNLRPVPLIAEKLLIMVLNLYFMTLKKGGNARHSLLGFKNSLLNSWVKVTPELFLIIQFVMKTNHSRGVAQVWFEQESTAETWKVDPFLYNFFPKNETHFYTRGSEPQIWSKID